MRLDSSEMRDKAISYTLSQRVTWPNKREKDL